MLKIIVFWNKKVIFIINLSNVEVDKSLDICRATWLIGKSGALHAADLGLNPGKDDEMAKKK